MKKIIHHVLTMSLYLFALLPNLYAEIGLEYIKGFDEAVLDEYKNLSPVYGYIAYYGNVIKNIRLYGNYGKLFPVESFLKPGAISFGLNASELSEMNKFAVRYIHPSFKKKEADHPSIAGDKQWQYPYDPIAALVQWLFPSPTGDLLVVNTRKQDPIGDLSRSKQQMAFLLRAIKNQLATPGRSSDLFIAEVQKALSIEFEKLVENEENKLEKTLEEEYANLIRKAGKNTNQINNINRYEQDRKNKARQALAAKLEKQRLPVDVDNRLAADLIYNALVFDGTFASAAESKSDSALTGVNELYQPGVALAALLGFFWVVLNKKADLHEVYETAGLLKSDLKQDFAIEKYTIADYVFFKNKIEYLGVVSPKMEQFDMTLADGAFVGAQALRVFDWMPVLISYSTAAPKELAGGSFPDCNEAIYRNFCALLLFNAPTNTFDVSRLDTIRFQTPNKIEAIKSFFTTYNTQDKQQTPQARNDWASIMLSLAGCNYKYVKNEYKYELSFQGTDDFAQIFMNLFGPGYGSLEALSTMFSAVLGKDVVFKIDRELQIVCAVDGIDIAKVIDGANGHAHFKYITNKADLWFDKIVTDLKFKLLRSFFKVNLKKSPLLFYFGESVLNDFFAFKRFLFLSNGNVSNIPGIQLMLERMICLILYKDIKGNTSSYYSQKSLASDLGKYGDYKVDSIWNNPIRVALMEQVQPALVFYDPSFCSYFKKYNLGKPSINMYDDTNFALHGVRVTALQLAITKDEYTLSDLQDVLALGADVNQSCQIFLRDSRNGFKTYPLFLALDHKEKLRVLLEQPGIDLSLTDGSSKTALQVAQKKGDQEIVTLLEQTMKKQHQAATKIQKQVRKQQAEKTQPVASPKLLAVGAA